MTEEHDTARPAHESAAPDAAPARSRSSWEGLFSERVRWLVTCWTPRPTSSQPPSAVEIGRAHV